MISTVCGNENPEQQQRELTLSQGTPQATFPLNQQAVEKGQTTVLVRLVRADNPDHADFTVAVVLGGCRGGAESHSTAIGSLGVYPSGKAGGSYAFDLGPGLKQMFSAGYHTGEICLRLELKALRASVDWKNLRVTLTRPEWKEPPRS